MTNTRPNIQKTYMPHRTYRLLSQMLDVTLGCLVYCSYFKAIQKQKSKNRNEWLIATHNAYYDLCVLHWCMIFGRESNEPTHFHHLLSKKYNLAAKIDSALGKPSTKAILKDYILTKGKFKASDFYKFREKTLLYRNKNLIHREHNPDVIHDKWNNMPLIKKIIQTAYPLYELITQLAGKFPSNPNGKNQHPLICYTFKNKAAFTQYYLNSSPFREKK